MEPTLLGLVLDSSVLITAERRGLTPEQTIESVRSVIGELPIVLCVLTVAEIGHGISVPTSHKPATGGAPSWMS
jgi:hypothetical protein